MSLCSLLFTPKIQNDWLVSESARMGEATNTSHLEKVERGYENMDYYYVNFKKERGALSAINFITGNNVFCSFSLSPGSLDQLMEFEVYIVSVAVFFHNLSADEDEEEEDRDVVGAENGIHKEQATSGGANTGLLISQPAPLPLPPNPVRNTSS